MRVLRDGCTVSRHGLRPGRRVCGEAVREAIILLWEASDRVCGKRLKALLPLKAYCETNQIEFTRCRPYRKNDQAYVEQKNSAVVRRLVGYRRLEGLSAARELARDIFSADRVIGQLLTDVGL